MELLGNDSYFNQSSLSVDLLANSTQDRLSVGSVFRSLSYFFYLANPYKETYQSENDIPHYDIEVSNQSNFLLILCFNQPDYSPAIPLHRFLRPAGMVHDVVPREASSQTGWNIHISLVDGQHANLPVPNSITILPRYQKIIILDFWLKHSLPRRRAYHVLLHLQQLPSGRFTLAQPFDVVFRCHVCRFLLLLGTPRHSW